MFGFKKRAQERQAQYLAEVSAISGKLYFQITDEIARVLESALASPELSIADHVRFSANAKAVQRGVDAVLLDDADAFDPNMERADQPIRCGAMLAHAARNLAVISGSFANPNIRGDINFGITGQR